MPFTVSSASVGTPFHCPASIANGSDPSHATYQAFPAPGFSALNAAMSSWTNV